MRGGGRNLCGRVAVSDHLDEARLCLRAVTVHIPTNEEIRGRRLVTIVAGVPVAAFERLTFLSFARRRFITWAIRDESVVAVRNGHCHRDWCRALFLLLLNCSLNTLLLGLVRRRYDARN